MSTSRRWRRSNGNGSAWRKNNRRELRHSLGRFLAIVAIVALGVGFFAGLKVAQPAMLRTGSQYVQKTELFDYRLVSTLGLTQEDADYFAGLDGVRAAEGARSVDLTAEFEDEGMTLKALTLSDAVNRPSLTAGRMPERADECLADADRFTEADLGKTLTVQAASVNDAFTQTAFTIVGLAETPLYLGAERGTTSLGGGTLNGFVLLQPRRSPWTILRKFTCCWTARRVRTSIPMPTMPPSTPCVPR